MKRRDMIMWIVKGGIGVASIPFLGGCLRKVTSLTKEDEGTVKIQDLLVERHDNPKFPNYYILPAKNIRDDVPTKFIKNEKGHSHEIVIGPYEYARIKRGEEVIVTTNVVKGHTHQFRVSLKRYIEDSEELEVPLGKSPLELEGDAPLTPEQIIRLLT